MLPPRLSNRSFKFGGITMNEWVVFSGTPVAGGQGTWHDSNGSSGIAIWNGDGTVTKL